MLRDLKEVCARAFLNTRGRSNIILHLVGLGFSIKSIKGGGYSCTYEILHFYTFAEEIITACIKTIQVKEI